MLVLVTNDMTRATHPYALHVAFVDVPHPYVWNNATIRIHIWRVHVAPWRNTAHLYMMRSYMSRIYDALTYVTHPYVWHDATIRGHIWRIHIRNTITQHYPFSHDPSIYVTHIWRIHISHPSVCVTGHNTTHSYMWHAAFVYVTYLYAQQKHLYIHTGVQKGTNGMLSLWKEPYILWKEPYIPWKEPYLSLKEP